MHYQALIFDCDGTLADTMPLHYLAWRETLARHGMQFSEDRFYSLGGKPTQKIARQLIDEHALKVDPHEVAREKEQRFLDALHLVTPIVPVTTIVHEHHRQVPMAVASGSDGDVVRRILRQIGLLEYFECIVAQEDTPRHKPDPDVFLRAAELLGVEPAGCCVYEDADLGLEAARRAGMACVDIRTMHTPRRWTTPDSP